MAQGSGKLNTLILRVQDALSRGTPSSIRAAQGLVRASFDTVGRTNPKELLQLNESINARSKEVTEKESLSKLTQRITPPGRRVDTGELQMFEQAGPPVPGVTPQAGQPGGGRLFQFADQEPAGPQVNPQQQIDKELTDFTAAEMIELSQQLPKDAFKQFKLERDAALERGAAVAKPVALTVEEKAKATARGRVKGTAEAKENLPLGENAGRWVDPETLESANPKITAKQARTRGFRPLPPGAQPQFVAAARSASNTLDRLEVLVKKLFPKGQEGVLGRAKNFVRLQAGLIAADPDVVEFNAILNSNLAQFARASGDVANIALAEQEFQRTALPGFIDTRKSALRLIKSRKDIFKAIMRSVLGVSGATGKTTGVKNTTIRLRRNPQTGELEQVTP